MTDRIKKGDLLPNWRATLTDEGVPVDLSTATEIRVLGYQGALNINRTTTIPGSTSGVVTMPWQAGDTNTVGDILFEVQVTWPGSKPQTFPPEGYLVTRVYQDLGP